MSSSFLLVFGHDMFLRAFVTLPLPSSGQNKLVASKDALRVHWVGQKYFVWCWIVAGPLGVVSPLWCQNDEHLLPELVGKLYDRVTVHCCDLKGWNRGIADHGWHCFGVCGLRYCSCQGPQGRWSLLWGPAFQTHCLAQSSPT